MVTVSRGVRIPEAQFAQIYEIWRDMRKDHRVQINQVFTVLLELGLMTFPKLSEPMRQGLFRKGTAREEVRLRANLESRLADVASAFRLDDRLAFALPAPAKRAIREEARRNDKSMSAIARERVILQEAG